MPTETTFKGFNDIGDPSPSEILADNLTDFIDWGFIDKGAYFNVTIPKSGAYGGDQSILRPVGDPRKTAYTVWEGFRSNWVWQSGLSQSTQPISISGVFVNNTFMPVSGGDFHIDYPNGRLVFNNAISSSAVVKCEYSYKWINVYKSSHVPWFREIQYRSLRVDDITFNQVGSGNWTQLSDARLQLPAIIVEMGGHNFNGYQLGGGHYMNTSIILHVFAEDGNMAHKVADYMSSQEDKTIYLYNTKLLSESGAFPLDYRGSIASGAKTYPQLVEPVEYGGFRWRKTYLTDSNKGFMDTINRGLYHIPVKMTTRTVLTNV